MGQYLTPDDWEVDALLTYHILSMAMKKKRYERYCVSLVKKTIHAHEKYYNMHMKNKKKQHLRANKKTTLKQTLHVHAHEKKLLLKDFMWQ